MSTSLYNSFISFHSSSLLFVLWSSFLPFSSAGSHSRPWAFANAGFLSGRGVYPLCLGNALLSVSPGLWGLLHCPGQSRLLPCQWSQHTLCASWWHSTYHPVLSLCCLHLLLLAGADPKQKRGKNPRNICQRHRWVCLCHLSVPPGLQGAQPTLLSSSSIVQMDFKTAPLGWYLPHGLTSQS